MKKSDCHHIDIKIYFLNVLIFIHWINHFITIDSDLPWNTFAPGIAGKCIFIFFHFQEGHNNDNKPVVRLPKEQVCLELRDFFFFFSAEINHKVQISMARTDLFSPCMLHGSSYFSWQNKLYLIYHLLPDLWFYISHQFVGPTLWSKTLIWISV